MPVLWKGVSSRDFVDRPLREAAESAESAESFQPHVLGEEQIPSISVTVIHPIQSPSGKNFPHIPHIPQCRLTHKAVHAAGAGPRAAQSTTVWVRASTGGEVMTSRLTNHRPMRIDLEADEPVQASAVANCPAIIVLL